jgi:hypothetical protein
MPKVKKPKLDDGTLMSEGEGESEKPNVAIDDILTLKQDRLKIVAKLVGNPTELSPGYIGKILKLCSPVGIPAKLAEGDFIQFEIENICLIGDGCE